MPEDKYYGSRRQEIICVILGTTFGDKDQAGQMPGGPCHQYGVGAPLEQINTRARGQPEQNCRTLPTVETDQAELSPVTEGEDQTEQSQDESLSPVGRQAEH